MGSIAFLADTEAMTTPDPDIQQHSPQVDPNATTGTGAIDPESPTRPHAQAAAPEPGGYNNPPENPQNPGEHFAPYLPDPNTPDPETPANPAYGGEGHAEPGGPGTNYVPTSADGTQSQSSPGATVTPHDTASAFGGPARTYTDPLPSDAPTTVTVDPEQGGGGSGNNG